MNYDCVNLKHGDLFVLRKNYSTHISLSVLMQGHTFSKNDVWMFLCSHHWRFYDDVETGYDCLVWKFWSLKTEKLAYVAFEIQNYGCDWSEESKTVIREHFDSIFEDKNDI